ncbi:hypothetical protein FPCIR_12921 [Fusarium pseudocircinatum]|uniref:Uncharacterized protein n=1 Tax=Fusarium pseudocircinatum TaxID=56676 RepID=A0A8H5KPX0_9HYPO|nr:hypothetical protein FPCIR_12921 [Fusarium pseudocircinatum]
MDQQPEITIFNPEILDWLLESVVNRDSAATIRRQIIHACQLAEQKDASATETLRQAESLMSDANKKLKLLDDERNALAEEKEKLLRDAEQLTSLPQTVRDLGSTFSSALGQTQEVMTQSLDELSNAAESHQKSVDSSSGETSKAIQETRAVGEKIDTFLSSIKESFEHGLQPKHIDALTKGFRESVDKLNESIAGIPAEVRAGLKEEMTLESFLKPFQLRDKLTHKEDELRMSQEANQRLIDQLTALQSSKAEVDLLLQQEKERIGRRNQYVEKLRSELEVAESLADAVPELQRQLQQATTEAESVESLSAELAELNRLYTVSQEQVRSQSETINRLGGQTGRIAELEERAIKAQQRSRGLEESKSDFEAQIERLTETLQDAQTLHEEAKESFRERLEDKVELLSSKDRELENLRRDLGDTGELRQRLSEANDRVLELEEEVKTARFDSITYLRQFSDSLADVNGLRDRLDEATDRVRTLNADLENANQRSSDAEEERQDLDRQLTDAATKLTELEGQLHSQETQRSLQIPEGPLGELAGIYAELAREVLDLPVSPQAFRSFDIKDIAVEIAPLLFRDGSKENLQLFLASGRRGWHCLETIIDGIPNAKGLHVNQCLDHETDCPFVRVLFGKDGAELDFNSE